MYLTFASPLNWIWISTEMQDAQGTGNPGEPHARRQPKMEEQGEANTQEGQG